MGASGPLPSTVQRAVEDALTVRFLTPVRVAGVEEFPYSRVSRCFLEAASGVVPATVIIGTLLTGARG